MTLTRTNDLRLYFKPLAQNGKPLRFVAETAN